MNCDTQTHKNQRVVVLLLAYFFLLLFTFDDKTIWDYSKRRQVFQNLVSAT